MAIPSYIATLTLVWTLVCASQAFSTTRNGDVPKLKALGDEVVGPFIRNGKDAVKGNQPFMVSIQAEVYGVLQHVCGGSLIKPNKILSAAHCLKAWGRFPYKAGLGYYKISDGEGQAGAQLITITDAVKHPQYKKGGGNENNDVVIFTLETPATLSDSVKLVTLSDVTASGAVGKKVHLEGWGETSPGSGPADTLQQLDFTVISLDACKTHFNAAWILDQHICALNEGVDPPNDSCVGDSGGPLMLDGKQVGIQSWGSPECGVGKPAIFGNVAALRSFIDENI